MIFNNLSYSKKLLYLPVISLGNMRLHLLDLLFSSSLSLMMYFSKADNYDGFYWLKLNVFFLSLAKALEFLIKEWSLEKRWS